MTSVGVRYLLLLFVISGGISLGQQLSIRLHTLKDGLPSAACAPLLEDDLGFLWLGSQEGLTLFDGTTFIHFGKGNGFDNIPAAAVQDKDGTVWIGGRRGVTRVTRSQDIPLHLQFEVVLAEGHEPTAGITAMALSPAGYPLVATKVGLYALANGKAHRLVLQRGDSRGLIDEAYFGNQAELQSSRLWSHSIFHLFFDSHGSLYVGTSHSIFRCETATAGSQQQFVLHEIQTLTGNDPIPLYSLMIDGSDRIWYSTFDQKLFVLDSPHHPQWISLPYPNFGHISELYCDRTGSLWVGRERGMNRIVLPKTSPIQLHSQTVETFSVKEGLPERGPFFGFLSDRANNLWLTAGGAGTLKISHPPFQLYSDQSLGIAQPHRVRSDARGDVWVSGGGLIKLNLRRDEIGQTHCEVLRRIPDDINEVTWLGDDSALVWPGPVLLSLRGGSAKSPKIQPVRLPGQSQSARVAPHSVLRDGKGLVWVSTDDGVAAYEFKANALHLKRQLTATDGLADNGIRVMNETLDGALWLGGYGGGLSRFDGTTLRTFKVTDGLCDNSVRALFETPDSILWIGTRYGGMCAYKHGAFHRYPEYKDLQSVDVWSIDADAEGRLWIATGKGLKSFKPDPFLRSPPDVWHIGERDGITSATARWVKVDGSGNVYYVSEAGLHVASIQSLTRATTIPRVYLKTVEVNGVPRADLRPLGLTYRENSISFAFQTTDLSGASSPCQYMIEGLDEDWNEPTSSRRIIFAGMRPGEYTFRVRAVSERGRMQSREPIPAGSETTLVFSIAAPFWRTWWFSGIALGTVVLTLSALYRYRVSHLLRIERMRGRIATDLHDDIGASLTRVAVFSDSAKSEIERLSRSHRSLGKKSGRLLELLEDIGGTSRDLVGAMNDIVWAVDPKNDSFENVALRMKNYATKLFDAKDIDHEITIDHELVRVKLSPEQRRNIYLIFKECLNNIARHSRASHARVSLRSVDGAFEMVVSDDGSGFAISERSHGNGLMNMRKRAELLGAKLVVTSAQNHGTVVKFLLHMP